MQVIMSIPAEIIWITVIQMPVLIIMTIIVAIAISRMIAASAIRRVISAILLIVAFIMIGSQTRLSIRCSRLTVAVAMVMRSLIGQRPSEASTRELEIMSSRHCTSCHSWSLYSFML